MLNSRSSGYRPLEDHEPSSPLEEIANPCVADSKERWPRLTSRFTYFSTATIIVCIIVDLLVLLRLSVQFYPSMLLNPERAELRSSYINLDVLYAKGNINSSQHAPIINHALSFVQVSLTEPQKILPTYHTGHIMREFGPVPLLERRLLVTPEISTVAQFRAIDFGMESCSLAIAVPALSETDGRTVSPPTLPVDVYVLPIQDKLDLHTVSYSSLPETKSLFAQLVLSENTIIQTPVFSCRTLSYYTFLLTCSDPDCHLDLIGTTNNELGLFMYQHQTI